MRAMVLRELCEVKVKGREQKIGDMPLKSEPLDLLDIPVPEPGPREVLINIEACGVCRTELDQIEGRIAPPRLPVIPGHQPVGAVVGLGSDAKRFSLGDKVGVAWIFSSCGKCRFCRVGLENLCEEFRATGCDANGGYAEYMVAPEDYVYILPEGLNSSVEVAPLMCAGVVGYRSLRLCGLKDGETLGLYGFGSSNHLVLQMANHLFPDSKKIVVTRNPVERDLALRLGADWVGGYEEKVPFRLDCAIDTTPAWGPVVHALGSLERGGRLVINAIRKEEDRDSLLGLDYTRHLWLEREVKTVANVTRWDAKEFLGLATEMRIKPEVQEYKLEDANEALVELKGGSIRGSKVLVVDHRM